MTFRVAVPPADRPHRSRRAMRVLLVAPDGRVLLFRDSDPGLDPVPRWWSTPGGGVDPGETDVAAAVREVAEETGFTLTPDDLVGPLAQRLVVHGYSDKVVHQSEVFWFARVPHTRISTAGHTADEQLTMTAHRWWSRAELDAAATEDAVPDPSRDHEPVWPAAIGLLLDRAATWTPGTPALDLGTQQEATVPV